MITIATVYYKHVANGPPWGKCYSPEWVDKLYRGVTRNFSGLFRFVCLTNESSTVFKEDIETRPLQQVNWKTDCLQLHGVKAERLVLMGLDTIITGNLDKIFAWDGDLAVPRDPYLLTEPCNGVVLQAGARLDIASARANNDMVALKQFKFQWLDDLFPQQILSYKVHVKPYGLRDARIVYFHGIPKPHEVVDDWVKEHWV